MQLLYIGLFGACGCLARHFVSGWTYRFTGAALPYGTLAVNVIGSFLIGLVLEGGMRATDLPADLRIGLTVGFLGGFTTFSTFSYESFRLIERGNLVEAGGNIVISVCACLFGTWLGIVAARQW